MNHINIIKNFIEPKDINKLISFIDDNINNFLVYQNNTRYVWRFGHDNFWEDCKKDLTPLNDILEILETKIFNNMIKTIKHFYDKDLTISSFWISKHEPGSKVSLHKDIDAGTNPHFKYSAVLYLNSLESQDDGSIYFPYSNFIYTPVAGELLIFPSDDIDFENQFMHEVRQIKDTRYSIALWASTEEYSLYK